MKKKTKENLKTLGLILFTALFMLGAGGLAKKFATVKISNIIYSDKVGEYTAGAGVNFEDLVRIQSTNNKTWDTYVSVMELGTCSSISTYSGDLYLGDNWYYNEGYKSIEAGDACYFRLRNGGIGLYSDTSVSAPDEALAFSIKFDVESDGTTLIKSTTDTTGANTGSLQSLGGAYFAKSLMTATAMYSNEINEYTAGAGTTFNNGIAINDNTKIKLGTEGDSSLYWDGSHLYISSENVTGADEIKFTNFSVYYFDNNIQTAGNLYMADNKNATFGIGNDALIFWNGSDFVIKSNNVTAADELNFEGFDAYNFDAPIIVSDTTDATSPTTGSIVTLGGLNVAKQIYAQDTISAYQNIWVGRNGDNSSLTFENYATPSSATPATINMGNSFADSSAPSKSKLILYNSGTGYVAQSVISTALYNFYLSGTRCVWYAGTEKMAIETDGTLTVATANYEQLITEDDDIPNKVYIDGAISEKTANYTIADTDKRNWIVLGRSTSADKTFILPTLADNLGDQFCVKNLSEYVLTLEGEDVGGTKATPGTLSASSTASLLYIENAVSAYSAGQVIEMITGGEAGETRRVETVVDDTTDYVTLDSPLSGAPSAGETFTVYEAIDGEKSKSLGQYETMTVIGADLTDDEWMIIKK